MSRQKSNRIPEMASRQDELEQLARDRFAFLVQNKRFVQRPPKQTMFSTSGYYVLASVHLGLQVQVDFRDEAVNVYLLRLRGDKLPEDGFVAGGERIRIDFLSLLRNRLHVEDDQMTALYEHRYQKLEGHRSYEYADKLLALWRDVVERHIDMVVGQPVDVLFPPPPPNASPANQAW